jgi:hypothetical protein
MAIHSAAVTASYLHCNTHCRRSRPQHHGTAPLLITHRICLQEFKAVIEQLYTPDARFQYPAAEMNGKHAIYAFWLLFLVGRAVQLNNVHSLTCDITWDDQKLQAVVQMQAWQHLVPLAWLDKVLRQPGWKVRLVGFDLKTPDRGACNVRTCTSTVLPSSCSSSCVLRDASRTPAYVAPEN